MKTLSFALIILILVSKASSAPMIQGISGFGPRGVSADGSVVVGTRDIPEGWEAAKWENGQLTGLGFINDHPDAQYSAGYAVSADGSTTVGHSVSDPNDDSSMRACRWQNGSITGLGTLGSSYQGISASYAKSVSGDGSVIVGYSTYGDGGEFSGRSQAFRWENGQMVGLGFFYDDPYNFESFSDATDISADGSVIVGNSICRLVDEYLEEHFVKQAFRWENGQMTGLGFLLDNPSDSSSQATAVSADGSVIVGYGTSLGSDEYSEQFIIQAFRWENGQMVGLGFLEEGYATYAVAVSGDGSIIVGNSPSQAFIWDADNGMRSLTQFLEDDVGLDLSGWSELGVFDISDDGKTIVGIGYNILGGTQGFIITIPEPMTILLLSLGAIVLRRRKI